MIEYLLYIFLAVLAFHIISRLTRRGQLLMKIPGQFAYPIAGNSLQFYINDLHEFWVKCHKVMQKYYPITRIWYFDSALIASCHPDDLEILLTSQKAFEKGYVYWYLQPWLKTGLLTSTDEKYRERRKMLTPAFHFNILKKYMEITSEHGEKFIETLKSEGPETVKSLIPFFSDITLNIIAESSMGVNLKKMDEKIVHKYKQAIHDFGRIIVYRFVRPYITDWIIKFLPIGKVMNEILKTLHEFTDKVLQERREYHKKTGNVYLQEYTDIIQDKVFHENNIGRKKRLAMLDLLLTQEKKGLITDEGIKEEVNTFTFEGHDTTAMAMTYIVMLLAENKETQDLARQEITGILDNSNGKVGMAEIQQFNYLECCIKESLRLYPPVAVLMRHTSGELQLKHALIPNDSHVIVSLWETHRDPEYWPNPEKFDPNRFLPENSKNRHPFSYVPFSAGPRNCIGQKFAMMELKSLTARILYDFYLEPVDKTADMKIMADIMLRPKHPVHTKFIRINK